jgi:hypothetical protein
MKPIGNGKRKHGEEDDNMVDEDAEMDEGMTAYDFDL